MQSASGLKRPPETIQTMRNLHKDLKTSIQAFLGIAPYVQMHQPEIQIMPETMCQDDVKITKSQDIMAGNQPHYNLLSHLHTLKLDFFWLQK